VVWVGAFDVRCADFAGMGALHERYRLSSTMNSFMVKISGLL